MRADKEQVGRLLKTARGQLDGILKMVEEDRYCLDIFNQVLATQSILKKANRMILRAHMEGCVQGAFAEDVDDSEKKIDELISLLDKMV